MRKNFAKTVKRSCVAALAAAMVISAVPSASVLADETDAQSEEIVYGDVNDDGEVDIQDVVLIKRFLVGWDIVLGPDANADDENFGDDVTTGDEDITADEDTTSDEEKTTDEEITSDEETTDEETTTDEK